MLLAILGRQPALSLAELENFFGSNKVDCWNQQSALVDAAAANIDHFGGILKFAQIDQTIEAQSPASALKQIEQYYLKNLPTELGKITLGLSWYGDSIDPKLINCSLLKIKVTLKKMGVGVRLLPTKTPIISTATAHHNGLGKSPKKIEIIVAQSHNQFSFGRSIACQNISRYRDRDQKRPKRDSRVGMLPPKLAQIMINLARPIPAQPNQKLTLLDPFCGTGVILQEAHLMGFNLIGSDIEKRMIDYTQANLNWLDSSIKPTLLVGNATKLTWPKFDLVATESYLGRPFSMPPTPTQITAEKQTVAPIITGFLRNLHTQLPDHNSQICLAVPAWLQADGQYSDLDIINPDQLHQLGFTKREFASVSPEELIYYRLGQSVARRLLILQRHSQN